MKTIRTRNESHVSYERSETILGGEDGETPHPNWARFLVEINIEAVI